MPCACLPMLGGADALKLQPELCLEQSVGDGPGAGVFRSVLGSLLVGGMKCSSHFTWLQSSYLACAAKLTLGCGAAILRDRRCRNSTESTKMQEAIHGAHSFVPIGHKAGAWPARRWSGHVFAQSVHGMHPRSLRACASGTQCAQVVQSAWQHCNAALSERTQSAARPPQHSLWRPYRPAACGAPMPGEGAWPCAGRTGCDR